MLRKACIAAPYWPRVLNPRWALSRLLALCWLLVAGAVRAARETDRDPLAAGAAGALAGVFVVMWFTSPAVQGVGVMLAAVLGLACRPAGTSAVLN